MSAISISEDRTVHSLVTSLVSKRLPFSLSQNDFKTPRIIFYQFDRTRLFWAIGRDVHSFTDAMFTFETVLSARIGLDLLLGDNFAIFTLRIRSVCSARLEWLLHW